MRLTGEFIRRGDQQLSFGLSGRGRTRFPPSLCHELAHQLPVFHRTAHPLVTELRVAKRDLKLERHIAKFVRFAAPAINNLGYPGKVRSIKIEAGLAIR